MELRGLIRSDREGLAWAGTCGDSALQFRQRSEPIVKDSDS
jgi:hypothetical protein